MIADRTRLRQILLNLLSNAIKYNREQGTDIVECAVPSPGRVRISVQDTGEGLRPDQFASLFQAFNRRGQEAGTIETGIGLVVTKRLVEMMSGRITAESTVGVGSVFSIELNTAGDLPDAPSVPLEHKIVPLPGAPGGEQAPLLMHVEDNPANLLLVDEILAFRGNIRHLSAPDAQLGIELARAHRPQVILMDINLPGLNGLDALAILLSDPATAHIPVIALTANAMGRDVANGLAAGFFRYLTKPVDIDKLNQAIDSALTHLTKPSADNG